MKTNGCIQQQQTTTTKQKKVFVGRAFSDKWFSGGEGFFCEMQKHRNGKIRKATFFGFGRVNIDRDIGSGILQEGSSNFLSLDVFFNFCT